MQYDVLVVGGGLLGCFVARNLSRYAYRIGLLEANNDVCMGISRASTAIIYPGYDQKPGSLKARLTVRAAQTFGALCQELDVPYRQPGSLMVACGPQGVRMLEKKREQGQANGVKGLEILDREAVLSMEPNLSSSVCAGLYAPVTSTVNPWELCIAAAESAVANGVDFHLDTKVSGITRTAGGFRVMAGDAEYTCRMLVNCAGLFADAINDMVAAPTFRIRPSKGDYWVLDEGTGSFINHIILHEPEIKGKGATLVPTVDGNLLLGPSKEKTQDKKDFSTTREGLCFVEETAAEIFPALPLEQRIRAFSGLRPELEMVRQADDGSLVPTGERMHDLLIFRPEDAPRMVNLAGIKTPGLTCADEIGRYVTDMVLEVLGSPGENTAFASNRTGPVRFSTSSPDEKERLIKKDPCYGRVVCRCRTITEAEIRDAIRRPLGAQTVDGVKRRTGAQMGRCQGGYCTHQILKILSAELGRPVFEIDKDACGSPIVYERSR
ncbi:NAD(P)/FAD-dependent oxidoreductase [Ruminococcaceae bacterium OttesenSCG-928-A11]|nr:NAD(P)/FAD-dependent oxidoreductase [Ruminococcaceae bacterium OttesenSCG-928-A11]